MPLSDMHHPKTNMYINCQQNQIIKSVKIVNTNLFAKNCKLHKFEGKYEGGLVIAALFALIRSPGHTHVLLTNINNTIVSSMIQF